MAATWRPRDATLATATFTPSSLQRMVSHHVPGNPHNQKKHPSRPFAPARTTSHEAVCVTPTPHKHERFCRDVARLKYERSHPRETERHFLRRARDKGG